MAPMRQTDRRTGAVRVRGRGEVGPKEEAVAPRQAQAGRARRPGDRRGRARQGRPGRRPCRPPPGGSPAARAAGDVGPGAVAGPPRGLRGLRSAVALPQVRGHPRHAPRVPDRRPPGGRWPPGGARRGATPSATPWRGGMGRATGSPATPRRHRRARRRWRPATTRTPSRGASATPGVRPASARRACPPRGPRPASSSSCSSRSCRRRGCAGGRAGAASTKTTRPGASSTRRGRPGATRGRATAPACARSPGGSATSSTGWATGCRPRHNSPGT